MGWITINSLTDPRVSEYRDQKDAWLRVQTAAADGRPSTGLPAGLFMAEGLLVIEHLLQSAHKVRSILGTPLRLQALEDQTGPLEGDYPVYAVEQHVMDQIAGFSIHRGLLACAQAAPMPTLDTLLAESSTIVALENLSNHDNVGGIFRNVAALGGSGAAIVLSPRCCDPLYRKSIRVSMGHALRLPFTRSTDWPADLDRIAAAGFEIVALTPDEPAEVLSPINRPALLLGAEGPGLTPEALSRATRLARIPISPKVDSLNVSVTAALALDRIHR